MASCTARARDGGARGAGQVDVEQQRRGEVADQEVDVGVQGSRPNSGTFSRNREVVDQHARVLANAAANAIAGVTPRARARGEQRVASRRVQPVPAPSAVAVQLVVRVDVGSAGGSGSCGMRCAHQSRSASRGRLRPRFSPRDGLTVFAVAVTQFGQLPAVIQRREVSHQGAIAHRVGGLHVQIDVQSRSLRRAATTAPSSNTAPSSC